MSLQCSEAELNQCIVMFAEVQEEFMVKVMTNLKKRLWMAVVFVG